MIEAILFGIVIFGLIWPYFIYLDILNFQKDPNVMEAQLPGRPARRTIGRKNEDVSKAIAYIFVGYAVVNIAFYGVLDYQDLLPSYSLVFVGWLAMAIAMFMFSPANRALHAYADLGHITVVHYACGLSTFIILIAVVYGYSMELSKAGYLFLSIVGAMLIYNQKPNSKPQKKSAGGDI